ncbi:hypothetical protein HCH_05557 [Hahella chejuensis KCTC 2396]|uniref:Uncharacterized protein n=1 Tax=Hahella chejuensis (strain KCTC 2396) TaxID=349521 RepID=Q2SAV6_HAHCH|nr:DUF6559 family protein [Hahella chejuensis]ABC32218.1 hypothetical protein HCH_05557 [Hahella chejuensis KCTC 2396]
MLRNFFKTRALNKYLRVLPSVLREDYGGGPQYTYGQITTAISKYGLSDKYAHYAVALFAVQESIEAVFTEHFPELEYERVRKEIADRFFAGDLDFKVNIRGFSPNGNTPGGTPTCGGSD